MKKMLTLAMIMVVALSFYGCASKGYVNEQLDPIKQHLSTLDNKVATLEADVDGLKQEQSAIKS